MILNAEQIKQLCYGPKDGQLPLLEVFDGNIDNNIFDSPAKVELSLGKQCYCSKSPTIIDLSKERIVTIPPNEVLFFETYEKINMPKNLSGRMGLKMSLVSMGLLMPSSAPVDPGYENKLYGMLYNLSSKDITLTYKQHITTLELLQTVPSWQTYKGRMANISFESFVREQVRSSIGQLSENVKETQANLERSIGFWERILTILAITIAVLSAIVGGASYVNARSKDASIALLEDKVSRLEERVYAQSKSFDEYEFRYSPWSTIPYR